MKLKHLVARPPLGMGRYTMLIFIELKILDITWLDLSI